LDWKWLVQTSVFNRNALSGAARRFSIMLLIFVNILLADDQFRWQQYVIDAIVGRSVENDFAALISGERISGSHRLTLKKRFVCITLGA
jgi:hypothetical protein